MLSSVFWCLVGVFLVANKTLAVTAVTNVFVEYGQNLGNTIPRRISQLLEQAGLIVEDYSSAVESSFSAETLVLSFGNASLSAKYLTLKDVAAEGFRFQTMKYSRDSLLVVSNGQPMVSDGYNYALDLDSVHYGAAVGVYAVLEQVLGFAFLHPMQPIIPSSVVQPEADLSATESPYWPRRTWHVHTQHPLEFTDVLNGYDIPMFQKKDSHKSAHTTSTASAAIADSDTSVGTDIDTDSKQFGQSGKKSDYVESWESMFSTLDGLFEWMVANRQNRMEVLLLGSPKWDKYDNMTTGAERQDRLRRINQLGHAFGVLVGADIPIANRQQHGWKMISLADDLPKQTKDIQARVDWAFAAEYDFISTESGLSEATKPSCDLMLQLFQAFTEHVVHVWRREALTKVHCSTSQFCEETEADGVTLKYPDPRTGQPINFNFLPTYASGGLGVMPHTVQVYSFQDPSANSYGNANFTYMSEYMNYEAALNKRSVQYYGETAYWVNVDVDVPLFLPLSGQRRLADLRYTAQQEKLHHFRIDGQMNFESGWEFGYYLSNAVTARAVWNPRLEVADDWEAFRLSLAEILSDKVFGADIAPSLRDQIVSLAQQQADTLIYGRVHGQPSPDLNKLSGHAYMSGADSWVDLERMLGVSITQPDKIHLQETDDPEWEQMMDLLNELQGVFSAQARAFNQIASTAAVSSSAASVSELQRQQIQKKKQGVSTAAAASSSSSLSSSSSSSMTTAAAFVQEMADCVQVLANRATHNVLLYTAQDTGTSREDRRRLLKQGRALLEETAVVMQRRVAGFRVPVDRIAGWRQGPTVYTFGYVWAASTLYYLWRDQGIAEGRSTDALVNPCYLNRHEPLELAFGWGKAVEQMLRLKLKQTDAFSHMTAGREMDERLDSTIASMLGDCLAPPLREFEFPRDL
mmetsp:Transcript_32495/g.54360  ORF Transcript_32495/g.54360 Transcript_32495/m.54360 type:complete len:919 (+) Transcript_32495:62-2818(+)